MELGTSRFFRLKLTIFSRKSFGILVIMGQSKIILQY